MQSACIISGQELVGRRCCSSEVMYDEGLPGLQEGKDRASSGLAKHTQGRAARTGGSRTTETGLGKRGQHGR